MLKERIKQLLNRDSEGFIKGGLWIILSAGFSKFVLLVSSIISSNLLGSIKFGEFSIIRSSINLFIVVSTIGLGITSTKFISQNKEKRKRYTEGSIVAIKLFSYIVTGVLVCVLILLSNDISENALKAPHLTNELVFGSIILFFASVNGVQNGILLGFKDYRNLSINLVLSSLIELLFVTIGVYWLEVKGGIIGVGIGFLVLYFLNKRSIKKRCFDFGLTLSYSRFRFKMLNRILSFGIPAALSSFLVVPVFWYIKTMLIKYDGYQNLALFEISDQWRNLILFIPLNIGKLILPSLSSNEIQQDIYKFRQIFNKSIQINLIFTSVSFISLFYSAPYILNLYGNEYLDSTPLVILALSTVFSSISNIYGQVIAAKSKMWFGFLFNLIWATVLIFAVNFFLQNEYGVLALSLGILISYFIHFVLQFFYFKRLLI
ncbi:oligosaccharide flippase family protein [Cyclobacterium xiamenense]|uniref:oligosaccharide flippase family protein n=1 Tax=Cyclobacterium xiamenense TaxID=1297121 RepID=UPI00138690DE|nr:oligosaccharide flippase family protein [Cyclobacterium xiamenense]